VFWDKKSRRWRCQLGHKNKKIFLGYFGVAEEAARAYDQKLVELHGGSGNVMTTAAAAAAAAAAEGSSWFFFQRHALGSWLERPQQL
jgi:hypothetical protein